MKDQNNDDNVEEIEYEETEVNGDELSLKNKIVALKDKLKEKEIEAKNNLDGWQRARAELVNKEKQLQMEKLEVYKHANANLLEEIIPVFDSYEMARKNKVAWESVDANWRVGVEYIFQQLMTVAENAGLKKIEVKLNDLLSVNTMHAVEEIETDDEKLDHTVSEIIQSGYELNGKLIREAKVKIYIKK